MTWVLLYGMFLGTIDHAPSHYFVPLVHLSVALAGAAIAGSPWMPVPAAASSDGVRGPLRAMLTWATPISLWISLFFATVR